MRKTVFSTILIVVILCLISTAAYSFKAQAAANDGYIVKVKNDNRISLFSLPDGIEKIGGEGIYFAETQNDVDYLKLFSVIEYIEPNYEVLLFGSPQDDSFSNQVNLAMINVESAWDIGCYGNDVRIGIIDSGIYGHSDIKDILLAGYNYYDDNDNTDDNNGHGTFISGLIAAQNNGIGIVGVAHKVKLIPLKCFGAGMNTSLKVILAAIYGAVDDFDCQIINMSFGLVSNPISLAEAIEYAVANGIIIVAAVGNDGNDTVYYPAGYENVIGVGSVNDDKSLSRFSQRNTSVFVVAPGNNVMSCNIFDSYSINSGTSFSAPIVTATIALTKCIDDTLSLDDVMDLLKTTSDDLGNGGYNSNYGYGLINIKALVYKMLENKEIFVSPIDIESSIKANIKIFNNTEFKKQCISIFSEYIEGQIENLQFDEIEIESNEIIDVSCVPNKGILKHMLWEDLDSMMPVAAERMSK